MSHSKAYKSPKCLALASPRRSYDALLHRIRNDLGERQMESFEFVFRYEIPRTVLERRNPLQWFTELENRRLLSPGDLSCLENFLELESLNLLLEDVRSFQATQRVVLFFQRGVEAKIPELCLDEMFSQPCVLNKELSRNFRKRCEELFRGIDNGKVTGKVLHSLLSRGVKLLINSCRPYSHDVDSVATKILYLSEIVIKRFRKNIIEHKDMLLKLLSAVPPFSFCPVNCPQNSADVLNGLREFKSKRLLSEQRSLILFKDIFELGLVFCCMFAMPIINWLKRRRNDNFVQ